MSKQINPESLSKRVDDPPFSNFTKERKLEERIVVEPTPLDTYTKWIVGIVGVGLVTALTFFAARDRSEIDTDLTRLNFQVINHETQIQVLTAKQERVLQDLKDIQAAVNVNNEKLDKVLLEIRKIR